MTDKHSWLTFKQYPVISAIQRFLSPPMCHPCTVTKTRKLICKNISACLRFFFFSFFFLITCKNMTAWLLCVSIAKTHQSSGSQSLKPFANGLLAIFSCVICKATENTTIISVINTRPTRFRKLFEKILKQNYISYIFIINIIRNFYNVAVFFWLVYG